MIKYIVKKELPDNALKLIYKVGDEITEEVYQALGQLGVECVEIVKPVAKKPKDSDRS